jgi:hypothetical protein
MVPSPFLLPFIDHLAVDLVTVIVSYSQSIWYPFSGIFLHTSPPLEKYYPQKRGELSDAGTEAEQEPAERSEQDPGLPE